MSSRFSTSRKLPLSTWRLSTRSRRIGRRIPTSGPNRDRLYPPCQVDFAARLQLIESQPNQASLLAYATDYRVTHHELDIELARQTLQTTRHVDGVTDHDIVQPLGIADASQDGFSVVHPDANVHRGAASSHPLPAPPVRLVRQLPGAPKCPSGIVDSARRCAKRRHDGIADVLLERATMVEDDARDALVKLRQQLDRGLGPDRFAETHESSDVGEEYRNRLASRRHARHARAPQPIPDVRGE